MKQIAHFINAQKSVQGPTRDITLVIMISLILFGFMLGSRPLSAPDEGRYSEIPREMVASGDYVTPRLNGVKYFEKPPLMYWAGAASIKAFGVNEWALRFWPAFLGFITVLATYFMGYILQSSRAGLYSATMLTCSVLFYAHTRLLILDMAVAAFMTLGLYGFFLSTRSFLSLKKRFVYLMSFFVFSGLGVLSKGLIGAVLPGAVIFLWALLSKNFTILRSAFHPIGLLLFLAIFLPWHILASLKNPEFFDFYIIHEHFTRYLEKVHNRYQPPWFFIPILFLGLFPWTFIVLSRVGNLFKGLIKRDQDLFFVVWAGFVFVFFSLSHSKLIPYILPVVPPLMLLTGLSLDAKQNIEPRWPRWALGCLCAVMSVGLPIAAYMHDVLKGTSMVVFLTLIVSVLLILMYVSFKCSKKTPFTSYVLCSVAFLMILNGAWPYLDERTVKPLALKINELRQEGEDIIAFGRYYQDLPPYVNQKIIVVDWQGELTFGMKQEDTTKWMMTRDTFFRWYNPKKRAYIVTRKDFLPELEKGTNYTFKIIQSTEHDVLVVPHT